VEAADAPVIVAVAQHRILARAVFFTQPLPGGPFVLLAQDVVIDILKEFELDGFAEPLGRLEPVEDDPAAPAREMLVEEAHRAARHGPIAGRAASCRHPSHRPPRSAYPAGVLPPDPGPVVPIRTYGEQ